MVQHEGGTSRVLAYFSHSTPIRRRRPLIVVFWLSRTGHAYPGRKSGRTSGVLGHFYLDTTPFYPTVRTSSPTGKVYAPYWTKSSLTTRLKQAYYTADAHLYMTCGSTRGLFFLKTLGDLKSLPGALGLPLEDGWAFLLHFLRIPPCICTALPVTPLATSPPLQHFGGNICIQR